MDEHRRRRAIRQHVLHRKKRWTTETLPRVRCAVRPNAAFVQQPHVAALLQHLSDALTELLMTRPLAPFPWLADYLRHACKLSHQIEHDPVSLLVLEMHKKRRVIENARRDTKADELSCKQLIQRILALQQELELPRDEHRLLDDDLEFLAAEPPSCQDDWSIDTERSVAFPSDADATDDGALDIRGSDSDASCVANECSVAWLRSLFLPQRDLDAYHFHILDGVVRALVHLQLAKPSSEDAAKWLVMFLRGEKDVPSSPTRPRPGEPTSHLAASQGPPAASTISLFFKTNYELMQRVETLKAVQCNVHERLERLQSTHAQLEDEITERNRFIAALSTSHVTTRTHAIMDGTPVFLNSQKHWVLPGFLLRPTELSGAQLLSLRRAETYLMQQDERRWRFLLTTQLQYDASVRIQSAWRGARASRAYKALTKRRRAAAVVIQRNYFQYLFHRAVSVPVWCVLGREVLVAPSVAYKCGISFEFYPKKDFPTGNYRRLPADRMTVREMMEVCRQDEECAGFSTDGAMKRFLPRKLSQLKDMVEPDDASDQQQLASSTTPRGLYVKVHPSKTEPVVNTGIIVAVPDDRFGLVDVVLDGTGVLERVPLAKLSDRWRRVRIRLKHRREPKVVKRTFVGGKVREDTVDADDNEVHVDLSSNNASNEFETLDEQQELEIEAAERRRHRRRRREQQRFTVAQTSGVSTPSGSGDAHTLSAEPHDDNDEDMDALLEFLYEDQATKRVVRRDPQHTYADADERTRVIAARQQAFRADQARKHEAQKLASVVRLQCAWRSKRAREAFRQVIALRAKEKEREQIVQQVHSSHAKTHKGTAATTSKNKKGFFAKLFRS